MFEVQIESRFAAAHGLRLPDGTREPAHRHGWTVEVVVRGPAVDAFGLLIDFDALAGLLEEVIGPLRDGDLNRHAVLGPANPSAENVARYVAETLADRLPAAVRLARVTVGEAPGCRASYRPDE